MARTLTPIDAYALINAVYDAATGQDGNLTAVDTSSFISVGESILRTGTENTLNALSLVLGRTFMAVRPYEAKLRIINTLDSGLYANRVRKISYYSRRASASGAFNTNLYTNHAMGFDNGSNPAGTPPVAQSLPTMWEQNQPIPMEFNFGGSSVWDDWTTIYKWQLQQAFKSEGEFVDFVAGIMTEKGNDIESEKEAFNRATLLNFMAGIYDLNSVTGGAIDMVAAFNTKMGTSYTGTQLRSTYLKEFTMFVVSFIRLLSDTLENRSKKYHWSPAKTIDGVNYELLRHTPKSKQKLLLYKPFLYDMEAMVMPEIFNDEYLKIENFEGVTFWQDELTPAGINITPAIPDTSDPTQQIQGTAVALDYVLGVLYDEDAMMVDYQLDDTITTPIEARKAYSNVFWHFRRNAINDFTENAVLLYMAS